MMMYLILISVEYYLSSIELPYDSITLHRAQCKQFKFYGIRSE